MRISDDIFAHAIPEPNSGCWLWERACQKHGYGSVWVEGGCKLAHRTSYETHFKCSVLPGYHVCHTCDNPPCINPDHLFVSDHTGNMKDKSAKGRWRGADRRGIKHPLCKLTERDIVSIREDTRTHHTIAAQYGVTRQTIGDIKSRKSWSHI